ncbi:hypothetical protein ACOME3_010589, partial [Neoechinorhynchus agilis]
GIMNRPVNVQNHAWCAAIRRAQAGTRKENEKYLFVAVATPFIKSRVNDARQMPIESFLYRENRTTVVQTRHWTRPQCAEPQCTIVPNDTMGRALFAWSSGRGNTAFHGYWVYFPGSGGFGDHGGTADLSCETKRVTREGAQQGDEEI